MNCELFVVLGAFAPIFIVVIALTYAGAMFWRETGREHAIRLLTESRKLVEAEIELAKLKADAAKREVSR